MSKELWPTDEAVKMATTILILEEKSMRLHGTLAVALRGGSLCVFLLLVAAFFAACWTIRKSDYCIGRIERTLAIPGRPEFLAIVSSLGQNRIVLFLKDYDVLSRQGAGRRPVLLAKGSVKTIGDFEVFVVSGPKARILPACGLDDVKQTIGEIDGFLKRHRELAVLGGVLLLVLGFYSVRLIAACALGVGLFLSIWLGLTVCELDDMLRIPGNPVAVWALPTLGFVLGCVVALQPGTAIGSAMVRITLATLCLAFADNIAETLGWPQQVVMILGVVGSVLAPPLGLALLAAYMLVMGLNAQGLAIYLVLFLVLVSVHVLTGGRWVPTSLRRRITRACGRKTTFSKGINELLSANRRTNALESK